MPRKKKYVHTSPMKAGVQNLPEGYAESHYDEDNVMAGVLPIYEQGMENKRVYRGEWTAETLEKEILNYFTYCTNRGVKPAKVGLALWLGMSKSQLFEWVAKPAKYGAKSELAKRAFEAIELSYIGRSEKYPTANIFLLKSCHNYVDQSRVDLTMNDKPTTADEVADMISKMGLDKQD